MTGTVVAASGLNCTLRRDLPKRLFVSTAQEPETRVSGGSERAAGFSGRKGRSGVSPHKKRGRRSKQKLDQQQATAGGGTRARKRSGTDEGVVMRSIGEDDKEEDDEARGKNSVRVRFYESEFTDGGDMSEEDDGEEMFSLLWTILFLELIDL